MTLLSTVKLISNLTQTTTMDLHQITKINFGMTQDFGVVILVIFFLVSCQNPFETRNPEAPSGEQTSWIQPIAPEFVLANLQSAIKERNIENYIRCFGLVEEVRKNFTFVPEISVSNNFQGIFVNWGITEERNYMNHLFGLTPADSTSNLRFTDITEIQFGDSVSTTKEYDLFIAHINPSAPVIVNGRMVLNIRKGSDALWFISSWSDFKTSNSPVWTLLKAEFK